MRDNNIPAWIASSLTTILGVATAEEIARLILLIIGIVSGIFSLAFNIYCWYKKAKEDGRITREELEEGAHIIRDGVENIIEKTEGDNHE